MVNLFADVFPYSFPYIAELFMESPASSSKFQFTWFGCWWALRKILLMGIQRNWKVTFLMFLFCFFFNGAYKLTKILIPQLIIIYRNCYFITTDVVLTFSWIHCVTLIQYQSFNLITETCFTDTYLIPP